MNLSQEIIIFFGIIFFLIILLTTIRYIIYSKIISLNTKGKKDLNNVNLLYDDYYLNSELKKNNKLYCNLGNFRKTFLSNKNDCDIKLLKIPKQDTKILIISSLNIDFELDLIQKYPNNLQITSTYTNLLEANNNRKKINSLGLNDKITILYSEPLDFIKEYSNVNVNVNNNNNNSDKKYDRIILRENLGNIKDRLEFFRLIKINKLLKDENAFIIVKTFTFQPIFEKNKIEDEYSNSNSAINNFIFENQKKIIDYWNYNFSTKQAIINDLKDSGFNNIYYSKCNLGNLFLSYNPQDFINILKLYFIEMNMNIDDLNVWYIVHTIDILYLKIY